MDSMRGISETLINLIGLPEANLLTFKSAIRAIGTILSSPVSEYCQEFLNHGLL